MLVFQHYEVGLKYKPHFDYFLKSKVDDSLLFWSMKPDATLDLSLLLLGC